MAKRQFKKGDDVSYKLGRARARIRGTIVRILKADSAMPRLTHVRTRYAEGEPVPFDMVIIERKRDGERRLVPLGNLKAG